MFRFLSHLAHSASELLAPNLKPEEELFLQWHNLVKELKHRHGSDVAVDDTDVPLRLQWVFNLIQKELETGVSATISGNPSQPLNTYFEIGPCLETALRYKIFDWLVALAKTDKPRGIKSYVLFFVTNFLKAPNAKLLLPKSFIYKPLSRLVLYCGNSNCSPWDREELGFLLELLKILIADPCLSNLFLKSTVVDTPENLDSDLKSLTAEDNPFLSDEPLLITAGSEKYTFPLLESFLRLTLNPDPIVATQAREAVVQICGLREPAVCHIIASKESLPAIMKTTLVKLYDSIPEDEELLWSLLRTPDACSDRSVRNFRLWLRFLNDAYYRADQELRSQIQHNLSIAFKEGFIVHDWLSHKEQKCLKSVAVFARIHEDLTETSLLTFFSDLLLVPAMLNKLLNSCISEELSPVFDLLEVMILRPVYPFMDEVIFKYLENRLYLRKDQRMQDKPSASIAEAADRAAMFRDLFPVSFRSCTIVDEEADTENYVRESHQMNTKITESCGKFGWPSIQPLKGANCLLAEESAFFDDETFNEGPLLKTIFYRLSKFFDQSYAVNLKITGIISKLCLLPHSAVREYLLDPTILMSANGTSLYRSLVTLVQQLIHKGSSIPDFHEKLVSTRQRIRSGGWKESVADEETRLLYGAITLEEFCKEIAARTFVICSVPQ